MDFDDIYPVLGVMTSGALDDAAGSGGRAGRPLDTLGLLLSLSADTAGQWDRIWLEFGEPGSDMVGLYEDPDPLSDDRWRGRPVTGTCACAIRAAVILAEASEMLPVSPGLLALCLVADSGAAATRALAGSSASAHARMLELAQEALVGSSWGDIGSVLARCFELARAASGRAEADAEEADDDAEFERFARDTAAKLADRYQALVDALNDFLRADTAIESGRLIDQHPELLGDHVDKLLARFIEEARGAGDLASKEHLKDRRRYLASYRLLTRGGGAGESTSLPGGSVSRQFGECDFTQHSWEASEVSKPGYQAVAMRCQACHVGNLLEMTRAPDAVHVAFCVIPADGWDTVSPEVVAFFMATYGETIHEMEQDGLPVRRETPVIGWRPESLTMHTNFTPLG